MSIDAISSWMSIGTPALAKSSAAAAWSRVMSSHAPTQVIHGRASTSASNQKTSNRCILGIGWPQKPPPPTPTQTPRMHGGCPDSAHDGQGENAQLACTHEASCAASESGPSLQGSFCKRRPRDGLARKPATHAPQLEESLWPGRGNQPVEVR